MSADDRTQQIDEEISFRMRSNDVSPSRSESSQDMQEQDNFNNSHFLTADAGVNTSFQCPPQVSDQSQYSLKEIGNAMCDMSGILKDVVQQLQILKQTPQQQTCSSTHQLNNDQVPQQVHSSYNTSNAHSNRSMTNQAL